MISQTSLNTSTHGQIKVFKYRWVILFIFGLVSVINFMQLLQFSIISNILSEFYSVESFVVSLTVIIFFISYIIFFYPVGFLIEKYSIKFTVITATFLTLAGNLLKLLSAHPDRFWVVMLAQFLIGVAQVYICSLPSKLATTWFGADEVSTACAIVVLGTQLGAALGCVQSPFLVTKGSHDHVSSGLFTMFIYQAIASGCVFVVVLAFFRSKPSLPPSPSQLSLLLSQSGNSEFFTNMKKMAKDKNFWFVIFSLGSGNGLMNASGALLNDIYLNYFPDGESDAGIIGLITIIAGGCIGSMIFGIILDKTHRFKLTSFVCLGVSAVFYIGVVASLLQKSRIGTYFSFPLFGFFLSPALIIGYEYLVEITYPIPEECSATAYNAAFYLLSIVITLLFQLFLESIGFDWTLAVIFIIICLSTAMVAGIKSDLKRRDANIAHKEARTNGGYSSNETVVTDARF